MRRTDVVIGITFLLMLLVAFAGASDWPQLYHDPSHTSCTQDEGPATDSLAWSYQIGPALGGGWDFIHISSPAVVGGKVYVGSIDGNVYCFNYTGGAPLWVKQLSDTIFSSPAVVNGKVYVGTWDGNMYCLDANTGDSLWRFPCYGLIETGPTVEYGRVFFGAWYQNHIWCLDANSGALLWESTPDPGYMYGHGGLPAVKDSLAIVGASEYPTGNTKFYAYRVFSSTPDEEWVYTTTTEQTHQAPSIDNGKVYTSVDDGWLYCLNEFPPTSSGEELWSVRSAPGYSGDPSCISIEGDRIYYGHEVGWTYCRDTTSGALEWQSPHLAGGCGVGSPAITPTKIILGTGYAGGGPSTQALYCLDKNTGDSLWSYPTGGYITSTPAVSNGMVFITSHDGYLYAFGTWTGINEDKRPKITDLRLTISPNPFITSTTIRLSGLGHRAHRIELQIFDVTGRMVRDFILYPSSFILDTTWDGRDNEGREVKAGIYFVKYERSQVGKVIKVR